MDVASFNGTVTAICSAEVKICATGAQHAGKVSMRLGLDDVSRGFISSVSKRCQARAKSERRCPPSLYVELTDTSEALLLSAPAEITESPSLTCMPAPRPDKLALSPNNNSSLSSSDVPTGICKASNE